MACFFGLYQRPGLRFPLTIHSPPLPGGFAWSSYLAVLDFPVALLVVAKRRLFHPP